MLLPRHAHTDKRTLYMEERKKCCTVTKSAASSREKRTEKPPSDPAFSASPHRVFILIFNFKAICKNVKSFLLVLLVLDHTKIIPN